MKKNLLKIFTIFSIITSNQLYSMETEVLPTIKKHASARSAFIDKLNSDANKMAQSIAELMEELMAELMEEEKEIQRQMKIIQEGQFYYYARKCLTNLLNKLLSFS